MRKHCLCSIVENLGLVFNPFYLFLYNGVDSCDFLLLIVAVCCLHVMLDCRSHESGSKSVKISQEVKVDRGDSSDTIPWVKGLAHEVLFLENLAKCLLDEVIVVLEGAVEIFSGRVGELLLSCHLLECF